MEGRSINELRREIDSCATISDLEQIADLIPNVSSLEKRFLNRMFVLADGPKDLRTVLRYSWFDLAFSAKVESALHVSIAPLKWIVFENWQDREYSDSGLSRQRHSV